MNAVVKNLLLFVGFPVLIAGNAYFYFTEEAKQFPEINFTVLDGKLLNSRELTGRPVLLNFWATTCSPCRKEIPDLINLHSEFSSERLKVIGIAMAYDRPDQVIAFKQRYKIPYTLAMDIDTAIAKTLDVQAIPLSLLISPRGKIEYRHAGAVDVNEIRKRIAAMLPDR